MSESRPLPACCHAQLSADIKNNSICFVDSEHDVIPISRFGKTTHLFKSGMSEELALL